MSESKDWKKLWFGNYKGEGDTKELEDFLKKLDYGSRKGVSYLPWAVVERIFKFQDGTFEIIRTDEGTIVEADRYHKGDEINEEGVVEPIYIQSYFINVKAVWQGREYIERYPLQSSTGQPLLHWTQNDLNKAVQRAKVKAIAIVSGIGYKLFEDGDLQFEGSEEKETKAKETVSKKTNTPKAKPTKNETPPEKPLEHTPVEEKEVKEVKEEKTEDTKVEETETSGTVDIPDDRDEIENEIKTQFLKGGSEKASRIKSFLKERETTKIHELSNEDIRQLYVEVV